LLERVSNVCFNSRNIRNVRKRDDKEEEREHEHERGGVRREKKAASPVTKATVT
jgi:hypothetical protein